MSDPDKPDRSKWLHDKVSPGLVQLHCIKQVLYSGRTRFQSVDIIDTENFGICLVLDGKIQSSARDEFVYHEALVHPAMLSHPAPRAVFIAGGGEGATLREVLAHRTVENVIMVDIDSQAVDICRRFLPSFHLNSFDDPRLKVHFTDARRYLEETGSCFDVIIIDLVEPLEAGPACLLYTREFYGIINKRLNPGGVVCLQAGASGWTNQSNFVAIINTLKSVFPAVSPYQTYVPSFADLWGFATASDSVDPVKISAAEVDCRIKARLSRELQSYDGLTHQGLFILPRHLRREMATSRRVITDQEPVFTI